MDLKDNMESFFTEDLLKNLDNCKKEKFEKGKTIVRQDFYVNVLPIVLSGSLRVFRKTEEKEILIYYVHPSETCIVTLNCLIDQKASYVEVAASSPCEVILVPLNKVVEWQRNNACWNNFLLKNFFSKSQQLFKLFDDLAFAPMDKRIKNHLYQLASKNNEIIYITHQELANELGTSRVVISRILKHLELEGLIALLRGAIQLKDIKRMNVGNDQVQMFSRLYGALLPSSYVK
jgi:CRP/FNR family transcriptional regulator